MTSSSVQTEAQHPQGEGAGHAGLRRGLKARHLQLLAIGGAIGTGLFLGSGTTISLAGPSIIFVYAIVGLALFFVMRALGELLLSNLGYKTFGDVAADLIGPWAGYVVAWTYWLAWVITVIADIVAITGYVAFFNDEIPAWAPAIATAIGLLLLNLQPVKAFGETEFCFAIIKVVAILALIAVGIVLLVTGFTSADGVTASVSHLWDHGGMFPFGISGFILGFQMGVFAFVGIELVGTASAEAEDPEKNLPKAINSVVVRILVFYVGALVIIMSVTPWDQIQPGVSPFTSMFELIGFPAAAIVVNLVVLTSAASSANSGFYSSTRMLYGLAKDGQATRRFGLLNSRGVPTQGVFFTTAFLFAALPVLALGDNVMAAFTVVTSVSSLNFIATWTIILVSYIMFRKKRPELHEASKFKMPGGRFMPWVILAFFAFILYALFMGEDTRAGLIVLPFWFIGLGLMWRFVISKRVARREAEELDELVERVEHS